MTIEAETLTQLTDVLAQQGLTRLVQVRFTRTRTGATTSGSAKCADGLCYPLVWSA